MVIDMAVAVACFYDDQICEQPPDRSKVYYAGDSNEMCMASDVK